MSQLIVHAGDFTFQARFEEALAPKTCAAFRKAMPFESQAIHVRWSGEGVWMPLGDLDFGVPYENHTSYPAPGQIILYPGGISETEILLAYGGVHFASKMGQLAGNHFITLTSNLENLPALPHVDGSRQCADGRGRRVHPHQRPEQHQGPANPEHPPPGPRRPRQIDALRGNRRGHHPTQTGGGETSQTDKRGTTIL